MPWSAWGVAWGAPGSTRRSTGIRARLTPSRATGIRAGLAPSRATGDSQGRWRPVADAARGRRGPKAPGPRDQHYYPSKTLDTNPGGAR